MTDLLTARDVQIFFACAAIALLAAWISIQRFNESKPGWAVRTYRHLLRLSNIPGIPDYADSRQNFSRREEFLVTFFLWFFVLFSLAVFFYGCGRHGC